MKCLCGHIEPQTVVEEIQILFQSGPRKGQVKRIEEKVTEPKYSELFIRIGVEKGFSFLPKPKNLTTEMMNTNVFCTPALNVVL